MRHLTSVQRTLRDAGLEVVLYDRARLALSEAGRGGAEPLLTSRGVVAGLVASAACLGWLLEGWSRGARQGLGNDFFIYWAASRLLSSGGNPYRVEAVDRLLHAEHVQATVGHDGYVYPIVFAMALQPLARLPAVVAFGVFTGLGVLALTLAVALLASPIASRLPFWELVGVAIVTGSFVPVRGSLYFGQANLLLLVPLAMCFRGWRPAAWIAIAAAIKLYPAAALAVLAVRGRRGVAAAAVGVAFAGLLIAVPNLLVGHGLGGRILGMLGPDTYITNESFNGALSRLARPSGAVLGVPVELAMLGLDLLTGLAVAAVLVLRRGRPWPGCVALVIAWSLLAAPKISLWDLAPLIVTAAFCWPRVRRRPVAVLVLVAGWSLIAAQSSVDLGQYAAASRLDGWNGLLSSLATLGALLIAILAGRLVWEAGRDEDAGPAHAFSRTPSELHVGRSRPSPPSGAILGRGSRPRGHRR